MQKRKALLLLLLVGFFGFLLFGCQSKASKVKEAINSALPTTISVEKYLSGDVLLPLKGRHDTNIKWYVKKGHGDDIASVFVSKDGKNGLLEVNNPIQQGNENKKKITLVAEVSLGGVKQTKEWNIPVSFIDAEVLKRQFDISEIVDPAKAKDIEALKDKEIIIKDGIVTAIGLDQFEIANEEGKRLAVFSKNGISPKIKVGARGTFKRVVLDIYYDAIQLKCAGSSLAKIDLKEENQIDKVTVGNTTIHELFTRLITEKEFKALKNDPSFVRVVKFKGYVSVDDKLSENYRVIIRDLDNPLSVIAARYVYKETYDKLLTLNGKVVEVVGVANDLRDADSKYPGYGRRTARFAVYKIENIEDAKEEHKTAIEVAKASLQIKEQYSYIAEFPEPTKELEVKDFVAKIGDVNIKWELKDKSQNTIVKFAENKVVLTKDVQQKVLAKVTLEKAGKTVVKEVILLVGDYRPQTIAEINALDLATTPALGKFVGVVVEVQSKQNFIVCDEKFENYIFVRTANPEDALTVGSLVIFRGGVLKANYKMPQAQVLTVEIKGEKTVKEPKAIEFEKQEELKKENLHKLHTSKANTQLEVTKINEKNGVITYIEVKDSANKTFRINIAKSIQDAFKAKINPKTFNLKKDAKVFVKSARVSQYNDKYQLTLGTVDGIEIVKQ